MEPSNLSSTHSHAKVTSLTRWCLAPAYCSFWLAKRSHTFDQARTCLITAHSCLHLTKTGWKIVGRTCNPLSTLALGRLYCKICRILRVGWCFGNSQAPLSFLKCSSRRSRSQLQENRSFFEFCGNLFSLILTKWTLRAILFFDRKIFLWCKSLCDTALSKDLFLNALFSEVI